MTSSATATLIIRELVVMVMNDTTVNNTMNVGEWYGFYWWA